MAKELQPIVHGRFRVVCRRADDSVSLVCMQPRLDYAVASAKTTVQRHLGKLRTTPQQALSGSQRPLELFVQRWDGTAVDGTWQTVPRDAGGFRFKFLGGGPRLNVSRSDAIPTSTNPRQGHASARPMSSKPQKDDVVTGPRSGEIIECILQDRRTKKGGWIATFPKVAVSGPVTNSHEMPSDLVSGDTIRLKLCGFRLDTGFAQFAWVGS